MSRARTAASVGFLAISILLILPGCSTAPKAERYFDREEPFDTLAGFVYAVDCGQYEFAYECLNASTRKLITPTKFKFAMKFNLEVSEIGVGIRDLILGARRIRGLTRRWNVRAEIEVVDHLPNGNILRPLIYLELEDPAEAKAAGRDDPQWRIDLERSLRELAGVDFTSFVNQGR